MKIELAAPSARRGTERAAIAAPRPAHPGAMGEMEDTGRIVTDHFFGPQTRRRGGTRSVIGEDTRTAVPDTTAYPFRAIAALSMQFSETGPIYRGTGAFIAPNILLTCAHNVVENNGEKIHSMTVQPGLTPHGNHDLGESSVRRVYFPDEYVDGTDEIGKNSGVYDYAVLMLRDNLGAKVGWFGFQEADRDVIDGSNVTVTGYPSDLEATAKTMFTSTNTVAAHDAHELYYVVDTNKGQSGSPIFTFDDGVNDGFPTIYGVHTTGFNPTEPHLNRGVRLNPEVIGRILGWMDEIRAADDPSA